MAAPVVFSVSPNQGPTSGGTTVVITGTGFASVITVRFGFMPATSWTVDSSTQITAVTPAGSGTVNVIVTTDQGHSAQSVPFTYVTSPTLSSLSPAQGPATGGTVVTLTGTGFSNVTAVRFGGVPATSFTVDSATRITAVSPPGAPGPAGVTVTASGATSNALTYTYVAAPVVNSVSPAQGPASGGTTVTLTGTGFSNATSVRFGGLPATSFTVDSATRITAVAPAHAAGAAAVTVTTPSGTSDPDDPDAFFFYLEAPVLTALDPASGPTSGGTTVGLTGNHLPGATEVRFDGTAAASFTVDSATRITAVAPAHAAGAAAVTVTTPGGSSNPLSYLYLDAPVLSSLVPTQGPTYAGTVVTLTGSDLAAVQRVQFGAVDAAFTVISPTQVTAVAPAGSAGPVSVTVTTPAGTSNGRTYTRVASPAI